MKRSNRDSEYVYCTFDTSRQASANTKRPLEHRTARGEQGEQPCDKLPDVSHDLEIDAEQDTDWLQRLQTSDLKEEVRLRQSLVMHVSGDCPINDMLFGILHDIVQISTAHSFTQSVRPKVPCCTWLTCSCTLKNRGSLA